MRFFQKATIFETPDTYLTCRPELDLLPSEWAIEFEVADTKVGRSIVAKAMNHGNSRLSFKEVRNAAVELKVVQHPTDLQGLVFSDVTVEGADRLVFGLGPNFPEPILIADDEENDGHWFVYPLFIGKEMTLFHPGDGFYMKSEQGSYVIATYQGDSWHVYGGGGSAYLHFLEEALKEAHTNGVLRYAA